MHFSDKVPIIVKVDFNDKSLINGKVCITVNVLRLEMPNRFLTCIVRFFYINDNGVFVPIDYTIANFQHSIRFSAISQCQLISYTISVSNVLFKFI